MNLNPEEIEPIAPQKKKQKFYQILYVQVVFAIVVGVLLGHFFPICRWKHEAIGRRFY